MGSPAQTMRDVTETLTRDPESGSETRKLVRKWQEPLDQIFGEGHLATQQDWLRRHTVERDTGRARREAEMYTRDQEPVMRRHQLALTRAQFAEPALATAGGGVGEAYETATGVTEAAQWSAMRPQVGERGTAWLKRGGGVETQAWPEQTKVGPGGVVVKPGGVVDRPPDLSLQVEQEKTKQVQAKGQSDAQMQIEMAAQAMGMEPYQRDAEGNVTGVLAFDRGRKAWGYRTIPPRSAESLELTQMLMERVAGGPAAPARVPGTAPAGQAPRYASEDAARAAGVRAGEEVTIAGVGKVRLR